MSTAALAFYFVVAWGEAPEEWEEKGPFITRVSCQEARTGASLPTDYGVGGAASQCYARPNLYQTGGGT